MVNLTDDAHREYNLPAEVVQVIPFFNFTHVVFRLPDDVTIGRSLIKAHSQTSNFGVINIRN